MIRSVFAAPALAAALALSPVPAAAGEDAEGLVRMQSAHSVETTLDRLAQLLKDKGLTVFTRVDHAANASGAGLEMRDAQVLIFGNPKLGTPLMKAAPSTAIDLPQKALAYEDDAGRVWLAYTDPAYLAARHGITGRDAVLDRIAKALDTFATKATR
jgi:uncharacterized protein (DUF302 family)